MKKINIVSLIILGLFAFITTANALADTVYIHDKVGQVTYGTPREYQANRVINVDWDNFTPDADAQIAITLNKKKLIGGYTNITRKQAWIKGKKEDVFYFGNKYAAATYRPHLIFNATNDNAKISGQFGFWLD